MRAGGDHHRAARGYVAVRELDLVPPGRAGQRDGRRGHGQPGAELERLDAGPLSQLTARYPGRKAEVVLDPGRCAGLAAGGESLDALDVEPLRCGIEGSGEAGRAGSDHDHVTQGRGRPGRAEADRPPELGIARIAKDLPIARDHDRRLFWLDPKATEQGLGFLVPFEIDPLMGHPISGQELAQAAGVGGKPRADQLDPGADVDQDRAPSHECAEDHVAQCLVLSDDLAQLVQGNLDHLSGVPHDPGEVEPLPGDEAQLAQEPVLPVDGDDAVLGAQALNDGHRSRLDDEEVAALIAGGEEHLARLDGANATELAQLGPLALVEPGKRAVAIDGLGDPCSDGLGSVVQRLPDLDSRGPARHLLCAPAARLPDIWAEGRILPSGHQICRVLAW